MYKGYMPYALLLIDKIKKVLYLVDFIFYFRKLKPNKERKQCFEHPVKNHLIIRGQVIGVSLWLFKVNS